MIAALILWYAYLPAVSFNFFDSITFYGMVFALLLASVVSYFKKDNKTAERYYMAIFIIGIAVIGAIGVISILYQMGVAVFSYDRLYSQLGKVEKKVYVEEITPIDLSQVPYVDEEYAKILGEKTLGKEEDLGSRVTIGEFAMQEVDGKLVLVAPLEHKDFFKYLKNREGTPGYIMISASNSEDVKLVTELDGKPLKIKYQMGAYLGEDLKRHIRNEGFWSEGLTEFTFELDHSGRPYWVVTTYKNTIGFDIPEAVGTIVVDAQTGETQKYSIEETPDWVDIIQPKEFVANQIENWGKYVHGIFNFDDKDKVKATEGMDTIYNDGNCYYYTGITSYSSDTSTNGFILVNTRTKEAIKYNLTGGHENAAQESAEGEVQNMNYTAGFPLPVNLDGIPTYFMPLKDKAGYVKKFAFVNIEYIQRVAIGDSIIAAKNAYVAEMSASGNNIAFTDDAYSMEKEGTIARISFTMLDGGSTVYMFTLEGEKEIYQISPNLSTEVILTEPGDQIKFTCVDDQNGNITVTTFENSAVYSKKSEAQIKVDEEAERVNTEQNKVIDVNPEEDQKKWESLTDEERAKLLDSLND
ncbi:MAG: cell shape-determining protein [Clostridia bacterium]|nr:cell shape-determining protein [Clostridia bacterium]